VKIGVAYAGELDVDKDLIGGRLLYGNLLVFDLAASLLNNLSPLLLGNLGCHCVMCSRCGLSGAC
jgi:hypothetical protein